MAFRLRHWVGLTLAGMALIAIWLLPVGSFLDLFARRARPEVLRVERQRFQRLRAQETRAELELDRLTWIDEFTARMAKDRAEGASFSFEVPGLLRDERPDDVAELEARVAEAVSVESRSGVMVGVFFVARDEEARLGGSRSERLEHFVGIMDGMPYCMSVKWNSSPYISESVLTDIGWGAPETVLGSCAYYLRYGMPGERMASWLKQGRLVYGASPAERVGSEEYRERFGGWSLKRRPFGMLSNGLWSWSLVGQACLSGDLDACDAAFEGASLGSTFIVAMTPELNERIPEAWLTRRAWGGVGHFGEIDQSLFFELEEEFGQEAFQAFWTSEQEPRAAFEAAFGVAPRTYLHDRARRTFGEPPRGPMLTLTNVLMAMSLAVAGLGLSVLASHRRRVA